MKYRSWLLIFLILVPAAVAQSLSPQSKPKPAAPAKSDEAAEKEQKEAELTALEFRALSLIEEAGRDAGRLENLREGARLQALAADLLWSHRRDRARQLFDEAFQTAEQHYRKSQDNNTTRISNSAWVSRDDVRMEIVRLINKHDPALGREYTEKFIESKKKQRESGNQEGAKPNSLDQMFGSNSTAASDLLRISDSLLEVDPKLAIELTQRAIAMSVTPSLSGFLNRLSERDRAAADRLFFMALDRLRADPAPLAGELLSLSGYPFGAEEIRFTDGGGNTSMWGFGKPENFKADPRLIQRFLLNGMEILTKASDPAVLQLPDGVSRLGAALFAARSIEPRVVEYQPALAEKWQGLIARIAALTSDGPRQRIDQQMQEAASRKAETQNPPASGSDAPTVQALIDRAKVAGNIVEKDDLYMEAALAAERTGDSSYALEVAGNILDLTLRQKAKSWISFGASTKAVGEKRLDDAKRFALDVDEADQRAYLFLEIAKAALGDKDQARARELMEEALQKANQVEDSPGKLRSLLGLISLYSQVDYNRAFEIAEHAVRTANRIPSDQLGTGIDAARLVRKLETNRNSMAMTTSVTGFNPDHVFAALAKFDFQRALTIVEGFESLPVKLSTTLAVAGTALRK